MRISQSIIYTQKNSYWTTVEDRTMYLLFLSFNLAYCLINILILMVIVKWGIMGLSDSWGPKLHLCKCVAVVHLPKGFKWCDLSVWWALLKWNWIRVDWNSRGQLLAIGHTGRVENSTPTIGSAIWSLSTGLLKVHMALPLDKLCSAFHHGINDLHVFSRQIDVHHSNNDLHFFSRRIDF